MRRFALVGFFLIALGAAAPASAADIRLPVKARPAPALVTTFYNWTGFYLGGHVGYGWADFTGFDPVTGLSTGSMSADGFLYGGQLGFNYQLGSWVFGIEGDFTFGDLSFQQSLGGANFGRVKLDQIYSVSGRIGYAFDRTLFYGKFGGAWTQEQWDFMVLGGTATGSADRNGWLIGAGIEYAWFGNWSVKLEYNYLDMGSKTITLATAGGLVATPASVDLNVQTIKLGVNYRFDWGRY